MFMQKKIRRMITLAITTAMLFTGNTAVLYADDVTAKIEGVSEKRVEETEISRDLSWTREIFKGAEEKYNIEINQGFSLHVKKDQLKDEPATYMSNFVAAKQTFVMIPVEAADEAAAKEITKNWKLYYKKAADSNGTDAGDALHTWNGDEFAYERYYDSNSNIENKIMAYVSMNPGPAKGKYNFYLEENGAVAAKSTNIDFYETNPLNILAVPVTAYYGQSANVNKDGGGGCPPELVGKPVSCENNWKGVVDSIKQYLLDVYPVAEVNVDEGHTLNASTKEYDMCTDDGQRKLWDEACKLQSKNKETGKDKYDLILAFVMYRQNADGQGQGYTYGKPANIITLTDKDMLPTVAHEIAHCYDVGDEYSGGSYNYRVNNVPLDYTDSGRDFVTSEAVTNTTDYAKKYLTNFDANTFTWRSGWQFKGQLSDDTKVLNDKDKTVINENGAGCVVDLALHPFILSKKKFVHFAQNGEEIYPTICYMGSGYSGNEDYYFTTSVIWDHLFNKFMIKTKKGETDNSQGNDQGGDQSNGQSNDQNGDQSNGQSNDQNGDQSNGQSNDQNGDQGENQGSDGGDNSADSILIQKDGTDDDGLEIYYDDEYREGEAQMVEVSGTIEYKNADPDDYSFKSEACDVEPIFSYTGDLSYIEYFDDDEKDIPDADRFVFAAVDSNGKVIRSTVDGEEAITEFYGGKFNSSMPAPKHALQEGESDPRFQDFCEFSFDAEYPKETSMFIIVRKADYDKDKTYSSDDKAVLWFRETPKRVIDGGLYGVESSKDRISISWNAAAYDEEGYAITEDLYTMIYYAPQGDDGDVYFIEDGDYEEDFGAFETDGEVASYEFNPSEYTDNIDESKAYVWIMVSDGVNGMDIFSDEDPIEKLPEREYRQKDNGNDSVSGNNAVSSNEAIVSREKASDEKTQVAGDTLKVKKASAKSYEITGLDKAAGIQRITLNAGSKFTAAELTGFDLSNATISFNGTEGSAKDIKKCVKINKKGQISVKPHKEYASYTLMFPLEKCTLCATVINLGFNKALKKKTITSAAGEGSSVSVNLTEFKGKDPTGDDSKFLSAEWSLDGKTAIEAGEEKDSKKGFKVSLSKDNRTLTVSCGNAQKGNVKIAAVINGKKYSTSIKAKV